MYPKFLAIVKIKNSKLKRPSNSIKISKRKLSVNTLRLAQNTTAIVVGTSPFKMVSKSL